MLLGFVPQPNLRAIHYPLSTIHYPLSMTLYLIGTPIGNLGDMTMRAIETLKNVDLIAAEDTRHTGKLLHHFQIKTPQISYHEHNQQQRTPELIDRMLAGKSIGLVTDAGMPGISDPGFELVAACATAGINVVPIPGVTAVITAVSASGLPSDRFVFEGFLPVKGQDRRDRLARIVDESRTIVLYESPHRLLKTLADLADSCGGDRSIVLARELTKLHEQFWRGSIQAAIEYYGDRQPQGEYVLVLAGAVPRAVVYTDANIISELTVAIESGISRSTASRKLADRLQISRKHIYQLALSIADDE
jgi:16S rRNA (cytidine1402-2'-O)-methyltransferase